MSQHRIQAYMDKHKLTPMFEELMNKVLRDLPEDPLVYLIKCLYKKASLEIPPELRRGGVRKSTSDLPRNRSPERSVKAALSSSADAAAMGRDYDRPWMTQAKRTRPRQEAELSRSSKRPVQRTEWNPDNRVKTTSFDDLWEEHQGRREEAPRKSETIVDARKAWANVGLGEQGEEVYSSSGYTGPRRQTDLDDPLASEVPLTSISRSAEESTAAPVVASGRVQGRQLDAHKHRQELSKLLASESGSRDSGIVEEEEEEAVEDEGIELLEDAEELRREGVSHVPSTGFRLSRVIRKTLVLMKAFRQKDSGPNIKLNIKMPVVSKDDQFAEGYGLPDADLDEFERPPTGMSGKMSVLESDEEFESVSQVTGPRRPAWSFPDSDDSYTPKPSYGQKPHRAGSRQGKAHSRSTPRRMAASMPVRFGKPPPAAVSGRQSAESAQDFLTASKSAARTWGQPAASSEDEDDSPPPPVDVRSSLQSDASGWNVPYDSDVASVHDWDQRVKGMTRDSRAY